MSNLGRKPESFEMFVSYTSKDEERYLELQKAIRNLTRSNTVIVRDINSVEPGEESETTIHQYIQKVNIALLLFSPDFIDSEQCYKHLQKLISQHQEEKAWLVPIILRTSDWENTLSNIDIDDSKFKILPSNHIPIAKWEHQDDAFDDIRKNLEEIIKSLREEQYKQTEEDYKLDINSYQKELITKPNDYMLWNNLASSLQKLGDLQKSNSHNNAMSSYEEALLAYQKFIELQPSSYVALSKQGLLLEKLDKPEAAADSYERGLAIKPDNQILLSRSSAVQEKFGKYGVAITLYDKILEKDQSNYEIWTRRGEALRKSRRFKEAIESFNQSLVIQPNYRAAKYYQRKTYREIMQST